MDIQLEYPYCQNLFVVNTKEINCAIFRHAVFKSNMQPINPHESKENCDKLVAEGLVFGCAKPFKIIITDEKYLVEICDYI